MVEPGRIPSISFDDPRLIGEAVRLDDSHVPDGCGEGESDAG